MCGLTGIAGTLNKLTNRDDTTVARELLMLASFRGTDSTGVFGRSFSTDIGDGSYCKTTLDSPEFINLPKVSKLIASTDQLIIGHTRSRTVGDVNKRNAQPFDFDNLIGTHNGTLSYYTKNQLELGLGTCPTDSEALYQRINKDGLEQALSYTDDKDAMALVWYDKIKNTLNFYRNQHRPLSYCYDKERRRVYWSSESGMLYLALNRNGVEIDKMRLLPENLWLSLPLPEKTGERLAKAITQTVRQPKAPLVHTTNSNSSGSGIKVTDRRGQSELLAEVRRIAFQTASTNNSTSSASHLALIQGGKLENFDISLFKMERLIVRSQSHGGPFYKSPWEQQNYDETRFDKKMGEGCGCCGCNPAWGEGVKFLRDGNFLCSSCVISAKTEAAAGRGATDTTCLILQEYA